MKSSQMKKVESVEEKKKPWLKNKVNGYVTLVEEQRPGLLMREIYQDKHEDATFLDVYRDLTSNKSIICVVRGRHNHLWIKGAVKRVESLFAADSKVAFLNLRFISAAPPTLRISWPKFDDPRDLSDYIGEKNTYTLDQVATESQKNEMKIYYQKRISNAVMELFLNGFRLNPDYKQKPKGSEKVEVDSLEKAYTPRRALPFPVLHPQDIIRYIGVDDADRKVISDLQEEIIKKAFDDGSGWSAVLSDKDLQDFRLFMAMLFEHYRADQYKIRSRE